MGLINLLICMLFVFLIFSVAVSGLLEWWAQFRGLRGKWLLLGLERLVGDKDITSRVLQHPLIGGLYRDAAVRDQPPSYVDPANFSLALAAVVQRQAAGVPGGVPPALTYQGLVDAAKKLAEQNSALANAVLPILDRANGELAAALKGLEDWFNSGMERVGGWYKAAAQRRLFAVGLLAAALFNVDTIAIFRALGTAPEATAHIAGQVADAIKAKRMGTVDTEAIAQGTLTTQQVQDIADWAVSLSHAQIPLGYGCIAAARAAGASKDVLLNAAEACIAEFRQQNAQWSLSDWLVKLLGWALTALAGTLGAPYWFGLLSQVVGLRGSGAKPGTAAK